MSVVLMLQSLRQCRRLFLLYINRLLFLAVVGNGQTLIALSTPAIGRRVFDEAIPQKDARLLAMLCVAMLAVAITSVLLNTARSYLQARLTQDMSCRLRVDMYGHLLEMPMARYTGHRVGDLMSRLGNDVTRTVGFVRDSVVTVVANLVAVALSAGFIFWYDWRLGLVALIAIPAFGASFLMWRRRDYELGKALSEGDGSCASMIQEGLAGIQIIKCTGGEARETERVRLRVAYLCKVAMRLFWLQNHGTVLAALVSSLSAIAVTCLGAHEVMQGHMTVGQVIAVTGWLGMTTGPVNQLALQYLSAQQSIGAVERVMEILDMEPESLQPSRALDLPADARSVEFRDVHFAYGDGLRSVLCGISLTARPGSKLAIIGESGAGKSTITALIMGLYSPSQGSILIGGVDIGTVTLRSLRSRVSLVLQDTFLFNSSILENIRYARPDATEDEAIAAAKAAYAHDFIMLLPDGYSTIVGERGITLSGGQRQRIAIAQAFLKDSPILVLDEAMSAVDPAAEAMISESLDRLMAGRTVIMVAHRESTIRRADEYVRLVDGVAESSGSISDSPAYSSA